MYETFLARFGAPREHTGLSLKRLDLTGSDDLKAFVAEAGAGVFAGGLLSIASVREEAPSLGGWEVWLPAGARLFATTALGFLAVTTGSDLWLVDTQGGMVLESDMSIAEFLLDLASESAQEEILHANLFLTWETIAGPLSNDSVLIPTPALPLGGRLAATSLQPIVLPVYLSIMAQLFESEGGEGIRILRLDEPPG